jgi:type I restriction enzyme, S subunit
MSMLPVLPEGWTWVTFNEVLTFLRNGISKKPDAEPGCGTAILRISSVRAGALDLHDVRYLRDDGHEYDGFAVDGGDILLTRYNGTRDLVGVSAVVPEVSSRLLHPDKLIRAKVDRARANPKFVSFAVNTGLSRRFLEERIRTTAGQAGISGGDVRAVPLPLAPRAQQDLIVDEIEKHVTRIDAGVAALERGQANLKRYRASVLKAAVEGRLVPTEAELARKERRDYEPASKLLARILKERRARWEADELAKLKAKGRAPTDDRWKAKYKEPEPPDTSELPELPEGWCWATVEQVGETVTGTTPATSNDAFYGTALPFIKPTDLDAGVPIRTARQFLSDLGANHARVLPPGTVLVTCIGATIGKTGLAAVQCATNQQINALVPSGLVHGAWLYWVFASPFGQEQVIGSASATTLPILNKSRFERLMVPVPPLAEQTRIFPEIERRMSLTVDTQNTVQAQLLRTAGLRGAILRLAFEGKLLPEVSKDERSPEGHGVREGNETTWTTPDGGPVRGRRKRNRERGVDA